MVAILLRFPIVLDKMARIFIQNRIKPNPIGKLNNIEIGNSLNLISQLFIQV